MINSINIASLRNSEFTQFMKHVLNLVALNDPAALLVADKYAALQTATDQANALFTARRGLASTDSLEALDVRRDNAVVGLSACLQGYTYHYDSTIRQHARALYDHIKAYGAGAVARENYSSETSLINTILNEWTSFPELAAAIQALQLGDWKAELDAANQAFDAQYVARTSEMAADSPDTLKAKRLETAKAYYALRDRIAAFHVVHDGAEPFGKTVREINVLIDQYNTRLATRKSSTTEEEEEVEQAVPSNT